MHAHSLCLRSASWLATFLVAGCQAVPPKVDSLVFPIYASQSDAAAVAAGRFGAVPAAMQGAADLVSVITWRCKSTTAQVRTKNGELGWLPVAFLPDALKTASACTKP